MSKRIKEEKLIELKIPESSSNYSNYDVLFGKAIPAIDQLRIISDEGFENFTIEWLLGYRYKDYKSIYKSSGSGDMGRDVIAYLEPYENNPKASWHNYQCKHYDHPIAPSEVRIEVGKHIYYCYKEKYVPAKKYYFIAPQGVGPKLALLLRNTDDLKKEVQDNWSISCEKGIIKSQKILLEDDFLNYFESFDFSIFDFVDPHVALNEYGSTKYFAPRFGGGLKKGRPPSQPAPSQISSIELNYVSHLYNAYSDHLKSEIKERHHLSQNQNLIEHFDRQREYFYEAESLREYARETLPDNGKYDLLLKDIYDGVIDTTSSEHSDGFECIKQTVKVAQNLPISGHVLASELRIGDKSGMCHQLANQNKLKWIK